MDNQNIEVFDREIDVINRINILNQQGYRDEDMYIVAGKDNDISILRGITDAVIKEEDDSLLSRFKSFLKGEDTVLDAFTRMDLTDDERAFYRRELDDGKYILFVDKDYGSFYQLNEEGEFVFLQTEPPSDFGTDDLDPVPNSLRDDVGLINEQFSRKIDEAPNPNPTLNENDLKNI